MNIWSSSHGSPALHVLSAWLPSVSCEMSVVSFDKPVHTLLQLRDLLSFPDTEDDLHRFLFLTVSRSVNNNVK